MHARGNSLRFESPLPAATLLQALNGISPEIRFTHAVPIPGPLGNGTVRRRWYRYFERPARSVPSAWRSAARTLRAPLDVRSFARGAVGPAFRPMEAVRPSISDGWLVLDVVAPGFAWGMVRKIVGAIREVEAGRLAVERLAAAARGEVRLNLPLAEPERLVLWETGFDRPWPGRPVPANRLQARRELGERLGAAARAEILRSIPGAAAAPGRFPRSGREARP